MCFGIAQGAYINTNRRASFVMNQALHLLERSSGICTTEAPQRLLQPQALSICSTRLHKRCRFPTDARITFFLARRHQFCSTGSCWPHIWVDSNTGGPFKCPQFIEGILPPVWFVEPAEDWSELFSTLAILIAISVHAGGEPKIAVHLALWTWQSWWQAQVL